MESSVDGLGLSLCEKSVDNLKTTFIKRYLLRFFRGDEMRLTKELWWSLWGIGLAFLIQILYDSLGTGGPNAKLYGGLIMAAVILIGLVLTTRAKTVE